MRVVVQRVSQAAVRIAGREDQQIGKGLLILVGICTEDNAADVAWLVSKISGLRIFPDHEGNMNISLQDVQGQILVISQFTLHASTKKGNRPSFLAAARPEQAIPLYELFLRQLEEIFPGRISSGIFGADMKVSLINDGPVTILIDSKNKE